MLKFLSKFFLLQFFCFVSTSDLEVKTSKGTVIGYELNGASVFEGIPYAKAPVETLRFEKPQPPNDWNSMETKKFKPICPQILTPSSDMLNIHGPMNEDCLYLNVYSPKAKPQYPYPVMVWIHGGGYVQGSASQTPAPGIVANLVSKGVVVVTLNYRLDVLGFFTDRTDRFPANLGMLDQIAALKWVQQEIRNFGGDPNLVTIFGYSAGGSSSSAHIYSPLSRGKTFSPYFFRLCLEVKP